MHIKPSAFALLMDKIERMLILCLRNNGRMSLSEITRQTGIPTTTVFDRMKVLDYVIKNTTLLSFERIGFCIRAFISIKAKDKEALLDFLKNNNNVNALSRINNGQDFFCEAIFRNMAGFETFNDTLLLLKAKARVFFVIDELQRERFFSEKEHFSLL
jgi:Lrp/AsnC family transcriptional regulator, leucine-responsive regulatory protein